MEQCFRVQNKIDSLVNFQLVFGNDLEGTINNEPTLNHYDIIKYSKMSNFPSYLLGKVKSRFRIKNKNAYIQGVGILIGPKVILTVAHNLCHYQDDTVHLCNKVYFSPSANCDFNLFSKIKSTDFYISPKYHESLVTKNKDEQLLNDWGIIYLNDPIGDIIKNLFQSEKPERMIDVFGNFYSYFLEDFEDVPDKDIKEDEMVISGYTKYEESYQYTSSYKFRNCFEKEPLREDNEIDYLNVSMQLNSFNSNQGKILYDLIQEEDNPKNIKSHLITQNTNRTESLIYVNDKENSQNNIKYIVFTNEECNPEFNEVDKEKFIMSESKGKLKSFSGSKKVLHYQITTYQGQSGSAIFRKKKNGELQFLGIHSRRGPSVGEQCIENFRKTISTLSSSKNMSVCSNDDFIDYENTMTSDTKLNGICDYNIGLGLTSDIKKTIVYLVVNHTSPVQNLNLKKPNLEYYKVKLSFNSKVRFNGLIQKDLPLSTLFEFSSQILHNIPKEYILLKDLEIDKSIINYNYKHHKTLSQIFNPSIYMFSFEIMLNNNRYVNAKSKEIISDFLIKHKMTELQLRNDIDKHKKNIFSNLISSLSLFDECDTMRQELFKRISENILIRLHNK